jgi:hypothetical protein
VMKLKPILIIPLLLSVAYILPQSQLFGQCSGPKNNGESYALDLTLEGQEASFPLGQFDVSIYYDEMAEKVFIDVPPGTEIHTNGMGIVVNLDMNTNLNELATFEAGPACVFNVGSNTGPFGGGNDGYIGLRSGTDYGWLYLELCGVTNCDDYLFTIAECRFDEDQNGALVFTGDCNLIDPIPTLSQWGIIILALCFTIFGTVAIGQRISEAQKGEIRNNGS